VSVGRALGQAEGDESLSLRATHVRPDEDVVDFEHDDATSPANVT
jgi:hypothetical protein